MEMVNRYFSAGSFRYGFNGKEKDNEDYGEGNGYDYGARLYNSRLGRFLSVDPLVRDYPWYTPYQFAGNKPIVAADLDGREEWMKNQEFLLKRRAQIQLEVSHQHDVFVNAPPKTFTQSWRDSKNIFDRAIYEIANGIYTLPQQLTASMRGADYIHNIGGNVHKAHGLEGEKQRTDNFVNGATVFIPGVAAEGKAEWMISKYAESTLAKIENQAVQQIAKSGLSELETRIVNEANSLLNSKEFQMVENAYKTGKEASVKIGNRTINYSPETSASSITMHPSPFFEGSGFQLGPEAFSSTEELKKTFIQELYRLNTQGTGMIDVDLVRPYTDAASAAAEKLQNFVIKK
jgi:RHS repeat-associated protein